MGKKKYVAYVGTYTHGTSKGIQVYDVDVEKGTLTERSEVEVSNASHLAVSKNGKYLYSIEDEGVAVFERDKILPASTVWISTECEAAILQQMWTEDIFMWQGTMMVR